MGVYLVLRRVEFSSRHGLFDCRDGENRHQASAFRSEQSIQIDIHGSITSLCAAPLQFADSLTFPPTAISRSQVRGTRELIVYLEKSGRIIYCLLVKHASAYCQCQARITQDRLMRSIQHG